MKNLLVLLAIVLCISFQSIPTCPNHAIKVGYIYEEIDQSYNKTRMMEYYIVGKIDSVLYRVAVHADSHYNYTDTLHKDFFQCITPIQLSK